MEICGAMSMAEIENLHSYFIISFKKEIKELHLKMMNSKTGIKTSDNRRMNVRVRGRHFLLSRGYQENWYRYVTRATFELVIISPLSIQAIISHILPPVHPILFASDFPCHLSCSSKR